MVTIFSMGQALQNSGWQTGNYNAQYHGEEVVKEIVVEVDPYLQAEFSDNDSDNNNNAEGHLSGTTASGPKTHNSRVTLSNGVGNSRQRNMDSTPHTGAVKKKGHQGKKLTPTEKTNLAMRRFYQAEKRHRIVLARLDAAKRQGQAKAADSLAQKLAEEAAYWRQKRIDEVAEHRGRPAPPILEVPENTISDDLLKNGAVADLFPSESSETDSDRKYNWKHKFLIL